MEGGKLNPFMISLVGRLFSFRILLVPAIVVSACYRPRQRAEAQRRKPLASIRWEPEAIDGMFRAQMRVEVGKG